MVAATDGTTYVGPEREPPQLTAPEYAVLLADNRPKESDVVRAALVEVIARGVLRLDPDGDGLLVAGPRIEDVLPAVLEPVRAAMGRARTSRATIGRNGVRVAHWASALRGGMAPRGYASAVVRPALLARGLLQEMPRRFWFGKRLELSADGRGTAEQGRVAVERARIAAEMPAGGWQADSPTAAAAVAALGAVGVMALADRHLVAAMVELRRVGGSPDGGGSAATVGVGYGEGADLDGLAGLDMGGLDMGGLDVLDSGVDSGGFDGGSGGGGDGGGGGGGGDGGGST